MPAAHATQSVPPVTEEYVPAAHDVQAVALLADEYMPGVHAWQKGLPLARP